MVTVKEKNSFFGGKRFTADLNLLTTLGYNRQRPYNTTCALKDLPEERILPTKPQFNFSANATIALSNAFCFYGRIARHSASTKPLNDIYIRDASDYYNQLGSPKITTQSYGLGMTFMRRKFGSLAPIGHYFSIGISWVHHRIDFQESFLAKFDTYNGNSTYTSGTEYYLSRYTQTVSTVSFDMEMGSTKMFTEKFYYKLSLLSSFNFEPPYNTHHTEIEDALVTPLVNSQKIAYIAQLKLGLGALLFWYIETFLNIFLSAT